MSKHAPNFLSPPSHQAKKEDEKGRQKEHVQERKTIKVPSRKYLKRAVIIFAICLFLVILLPGAIGAIQALLHGLSAKKAVTVAREKIVQQDIRAARSEVERARDSLQKSREDLRNLGWWRDMPGLGTYIRALEDAAGAGSETLNSADDVLSVLVVLADALQTGEQATDALSTGIAPTRRFQDLTPEEKRDLLQKFHAELPRLRLAKDKMDLALELWKRVPQDRLAPPIRKSLEPLATSIPLLQQSLDRAIPLLEILIPLAGYPEEQRFLVALQNANEIRPGGGFIGNIGTITMNAGDMTEFAFSDIYAIDNPVSGVWKENPPEPLQKYLGVPQWFLRDANWSPDFPTSAERVLDFFIREVELQAHAPLVKRPAGYIALQPAFFESLLRLVGPLTVEGKTFTADNFLEKLQFEVEVAWHQQGLPVEKRKEIVAKLGEEMKANIFALPASRWPELLELVTRALEKKHIMVYSRNKDILALLDRRGWTARAKSTDTDFVWIVDANLAALKTDEVMSKQAVYSLDLNHPDGPTATVTLVYKNGAKGFNDYRYTRYRSYTRLYVPEGSTLISSSGAMRDDLHNTGGRLIPGTVDVFKDLGKTAFGAFWSIEPGRTGKLTFTYRLPASFKETIIQSGRYHLDWLKQPGVEDMNLTVDLSFGKNVKSATPAEEVNKWGDGRYEYTTDSTMDREFEVKF